jgi:2-polyprenyl-3-methyl-5-hydroxy-6-metoxy-1,4-benzoquinol methylase
MRCEICESSGSALWVTVSGYDFYRCRRCRHLFVYPLPAAELISRYYGNSAFYDDALQQERRMIRDARSRLGLLSRLARRYRIDKELLDIGCASGIFMRQAFHSGWHTTGIEMSPPLVSLARSQGLEVIHARIEEACIERSFGVITAWEVLEHCLDPVSLMQRLRSLLRPGGLLAVSTPSSTGIMARVLRSRFPMLCPPEHLRLFSRSSLMQLAARFELKPIFRRSFSNLGTANLQRGVARYLFPPARVSGPVGDLLSRIIAPILFPACRLMDAAGLGSEFEVVFRCVA